MNDRFVIKYNTVVSIYNQSVQEYEKQINVLPFLTNVERKGMNVHFIIMKVKNDL